MNFDVDTEEVGPDAYVVSLTGEVEILGLDPGDAPEPRSGSAGRSAPPISAFSRKLFQKGLQTITWKADDPNGDTLAYDVYYRPQGEGRYRLLRKGLADAVLTWDTSTVPSGRYVIKVVASDAPSNPPALALSGDKESAPFDVDNTPPTVTATVVARQPLRLRVSAKDDSSIIRKTEYSVDGGRWQEIHPVDGLNDSLEESYEVEPGELVGPPPHVVVVRVMDQLGNVATARVELP